MKTFSSSILILLVLMTMGIIPAIAQRPGGGFDPDEMIKREKQNVFKALTDLNEDQKMLLDGIYDEFSASFTELREEMMKTRDFQGMRPKMEALQTEKNGLVKDVLNEDQYNIYLGIIEERKKERANRPPGSNPNQTAPNGNNPSSDIAQ